MKVLLVEDDRSNRKYEQWLLEDLGCEVTAVADAEMALYTLSREQPDLVLLDILLPGESGLALGRHIRASGGVFAKVPMIAVTYADMDREVLAEAGFDGFLPKPFTKRDFVSAVARVARATGLALG